eukprot:CAMPEP_0179127292 /NCGR_PEP_ID=MMETSP0796-20121207/60296_1 /TAXON_ID=73915 /ORGANISM="Pyrodinium bahamense, Strain pbaha01" /LENGTH=36 /DNA_ID= /DNA_START= /DNA_END= /DNA_ORIENTATION=
MCARFFDEDIVRPWAQNLTNLQADLKARMASLPSRR